MLIYLMSHLQRIKEMKRILSLLFVIMGVLLVHTSCEQKYDKEFNWAYPVAGQWKCNAYVNGENIYGPFEIKSYNSSFGQDSIWIDDYNGNFWQFKIKTAVDMPNRTFQTSNSTNAIAGYGINIKVSNGRIINNDSISLDIEFEDDPDGLVYTIAGHRSQYYDDYMQD